MSLRKVSLYGVGLLTAVLVTACAGPGTQLQTSWVEPTASGHKIGKLLIIGVASKDGVRRQYEDAFARRLAAENTMGMASYMALQDAGSINEESVRPVVEQNKVTHILVTRVIDHKTVTSYVPPTTSVYVGGMPSYYPSYYGSWGGYYGSSYAAVTSPGYTYETEYVNLETNVYDVATAKLIWSGLSETELGGKLDNSIANFIEVIATAMKKDGLL